MIVIKEQEIMQNWSKDYMAPAVTIKCTTYNHANYISQALDSFLMQKTTFPFEIVVHDDCSTDRTSAIIKEYEKKFPTIIRPIYEEVNQYSLPNGKINILRKMTQKARGKYIAMCEGDDYWISDHKLQIQYDALESSSKSFCVCRTKIDTGIAMSPFDENILPDSTFKYKQSCIINDEELAKLVFKEYHYPFHTSSFFYTKEAEEYTGFDNMCELTEGDEILLKKMILFGGVCFINEVMSCYRWGAKDGWTTKFLASSEDEKYVHSLNAVRANQIFDNVTSQKYHKFVSEHNFNALANWLFIIGTRRVLSDIKDNVDLSVRNLGGKKAKVFYFLARKCPFAGKIFFCMGRLIKKF